MLFNLYNNMLKNSMEINQLINQYTYLLLQAYQCSLKINLITTYNTLSAHLYLIINI